MLCDATLNYQTVVRIYGLCSRHICHAFGHVLSLGGPPNPRLLTILYDIVVAGKSRINFGWTPLHLATYFAHKEVVEVLLDAGVNVDEVNDNGDTALHKASFTGNEVSILVS